MAEEKIIPRHQIVAKSREQANLPIILTSGAFDILHPGHVELLEKAKRVSDRNLPLVVAVNSDRSVREYKPYKTVSRPIVPEDDRASLVAALECTDYVFLFDEPNNVLNVRILRPEYFVKGGYTMQALNQAEVDTVRHHGTKIRLFGLTGSHSTTNIVKRIREDGKRSL